MKLAPGYVAQDDTPSGAVLDGYAPEMGSRTDLVENTCSVDRSDAILRLKRRNVHHPLEGTTDAPPSTGTQPDG